MEQLKREQSGDFSGNPEKAAAEATFLESLNALRHNAADAGAAQCISLLEAVTGGIAGSACSVDRPLTNFVVLGDLRRAKLAADEKVLGLLAVLMRKHASNARVQAACCDLLVQVAQLHPAALTKERVGVTATAVLDTACAHTGDLVAQFRACQAIVALTGGGNHGYLPCRLERARALAVCDAICAARKIHVASAELQNVSLQALGNIGSHAGMHIGALRAALATLRACNDDVSAACLTLTGMTEGSDNEGRLALCDASASVVIATMRRCLHSSARLQGRASMTLAKLAETADTAELVCSLSGIEAVVNALRVHNAQSQTSRWNMVEESAWYALLMMTRFGDAQSQRAIDAGALSLPQASSEEAKCERRELFERLRTLQQRTADAAAAKQRLVREELLRREAEAEAAEHQRKADAEAAEAAKQRADAAAAAAAAVAAAVADNEASKQRAALAADAAMAALLAEEEAERAAAGTKPADKPKRKPKAARAAPAPAPEPVPAAASAEAAQPSASAARRRRRAAAKAASREPDARADAATSAQPLAADGSASHTDASHDHTAQSPASDDDASEVANAELSDALQSAHVASPADAAHVAKLLAENEERACTICLDAPRCVALFPCRHLALCGAPECAAMLGAPPMCPLCRKPVADMIQLFT